MNSNSISGANAGQGTAAADLPENGRIGLPKGVLKLILAKLPPAEDINTRLVCKTWNQIISSLPDPELSVFGADAWEKFYGLEIEGEIPPLTEEILSYSRTLRRQVAGTEFGPPCTAILMPKGLTLNKLKDLMEKPVEGNSTKFKKISDRIVAELGKNAVEQSYWFVMTNDVIEGSRGKRYKKQMALVAQKTESTCQLPTTLEAIVCCVMHYVSSGKYLFGKAAWNYTRTQDQVNGYPSVIGGFASDGLRVILDDCGFDCESLGVSVCRKFNN